MAPDICKCHGDWCPLRNTCYRYTSKADTYQSYFMHTPYDEENKRCEHYWPDKVIKAKNYKEEEEDIIDD